jgi:hypothetical protein
MLEKILGDSCSWEWRSRGITTQKDVVKEPKNFHDTQHDTIISNFKAERISQYFENKWNFYA